MMLTSCRGSWRQYLPRDNVLRDLMLMEESRIRQRICKWSASLVGLLFLYVASYVPYLRLRFGADPPPPDPAMFCVLYDIDEAWENESSHGFYVPVEWLVDHTPVARPVFWWADVCGVYQKTRCDAVMRSFERQM